MCRTYSSELHETPAPADYPWAGEPLHGSFSYKKKKIEKTAPRPWPVESEWEGGFDAVIGNPPYVRIQGFPAAQIAYFSRRYRSASGNFDLYIPFVERGVQLLRTGGLLGMITPNKFFRTDYGEGLRGLLSSERAVRRIVDFGANQVFAATTYTCLMFLQRGGVERFEIAEVLADKESLHKAKFQQRSSDALGGKPWTFENETTARLLGKLERNAVRLLGPPGRHESWQQHGR